MRRSEKQGRRRSGPLGTAGGRVDLRIKKANQPGIDWKEYLSDWFAAKIGPVRRCPHARHAQKDLTSSNGNSGPLIPPARIGHRMNLHEPYERSFHSSLLLPPK